MAPLSWLANVLRDTELAAKMNEAAYLWETGGGEGERERGRENERKREKVREREHDHIHIKC